MREENGRRKKSKKQQQQQQYKKKKKQNPNKQHNKGVGSVTRAGAQVAARRRSEHKRDERQRRRAARKRRTKVAARQLVSKLEVVVVDLPEVRGRRGAVRRHSAHDAYARVSERTCVLHSAAQRSARVLADAAAAAPTQVARQQKIERDTHTKKNEDRGERHRVRRRTRVASEHSAYQVGSRPSRPSMLSGCSSSSALVSIVSVCGAAQAASCRGWSLSGS